MKTQKSKTSSNFELSGEDWRLKIKLALKYKNILIEAKFTEIS